MSFETELIRIAEREWQRWGYSTRGLAGDGASTGGVESKMPFVGYVNDYWRAVDKPNWNGLTPQPWSAAFISFCFKEAGAGERFPYNQGHAGYCGEIVRKSTTYPELSLLDPSTRSPKLGDLVLAARTSKDCVAPPKSYSEAVQRLKDGKWFCSHADIVVAVSERSIEVIGGNVQNSVTRTRLATDQEGRLKDSRHVWLAVVGVDL
jgi:hypothetical protein